MHLLCTSRSITGGIRALAGHHLDFFDEERTVCAKEINQRARARILKTTRNHGRNADSKRFNTTIYTHVPLHDIDSIQSDERFIFERASISHAREKLNDHEEIRDSNAHRCNYTQRASLMNYELQSAERSS